MEAKSRTPQKFNKTPRVCVLGITGAGKSKFLSTLAGCTKDDQELFAVSAEGESCTSQINQEKVDWFGNPSNDSVFLVDTCGYGDSGGKDEDNTTEMFLILRALTYVNHFLLVLNSQVPRMDEQIQKMFVRFRTVFGEKVFSHISVIYNRWGYTKTDVNRRKREKYSEELRIKEINDIFAKLCNIDTEKHPIPCFFVDCYEFIEGDCDLQKAEFERIRNQCVSSDQFIVAELSQYSLMTEELQKLDEEKQKKVLIQKEQEGILKIIAKKKPELASKIQDFRKNLVENKINAQKSLSKKLSKYFDMRDKTKPPSLINDIWTICQEFNEEDKKIKRTLKGGFSDGLAKAVNSQIGESIEKQITQFLKDVANDFVQELVRAIPSDISLDLNALSTSSIGTGMVAAALTVASVYIAAELGLAAALTATAAVLLGPIILAGGALLAIKATVWSRDGEIESFVNKMTDKIATNKKMRMNFNEVAEKALDSLMDEQVMKITQIIFDTFQELFKD